MGLYNGEKRRQEDRRGEGGRRKEGDRRKEVRKVEVERRKGDRRQEERRIEYRIRTKRKRRRTLFWMLIIVFVSLLISALIGTLVINEKYYKFKDDSYRPMDSERRIYELEKALEKTKSVGEK